MGSLDMTVPKAGREPEQIVKFRIERVYSGQNERTDWFIRALRIARLATTFGMTGVGYAIIPRCLLPRCPRLMERLGGLVRARSPEQAGALFQEANIRCGARTLIMACLVAASLGGGSAGSMAAASLASHHVLSGKSVKGRTIPAYAFGSGKDVVLLLGGMEGDEPSGTQLVKRFANWIAHLKWGSGRNKVVIVPAVNPDGLARNTRMNARHVDINRNFPSVDWGSPHRRKRDNPGPRPASEPETRFVLRLMRQYHPCRVISVHDPYHVINIDGPAMSIAEKMRHYNHYRIVRYIGYPTPGSLGTYAGKDRHIPVVTLELPLRSADRLWRENRYALLAAVRTACRR